MKLLSPEGALYLYKSTKQPCMDMEYCCHIWIGAPGATWNWLTSYKNEYAELMQSFPYENHNNGYKRLSSRLWPMLFIHQVFLLHTLSSSVAK